MFDQNHTKAQKGIIMAKKIYVKVNADFDADGNITPRSVIWEDGHVFEIDRVLSSCRRASLKAGGIGIRYTVRIGKRTTYLYFEDPAWFVEGKEVG